MRRKGGGMEQRQSRGPPAGRQGSASAGADLGIMGRGWGHRWSHQEGGGRGGLRIRSGVRVQGMAGARLAVIRPSRVCCRRADDAAPRHGRRRRCRCPVRLCGKGGTHGQPGGWARRSAARAEGGVATGSGAGQAGAHGVPHHAALPGWSPAGPPAPPSHALGPLGLPGGGELALGALGEGQPPAYLDSGGYRCT